MTNATCPNCGVPISDDPGGDGMHPVQQRTPTEEGEEYCVACVYGGSGAEGSEGEYEHTGDVVARAAQVGEGDEELARLLAETMHAEELRAWMSNYGLTRSRGARKMESARQAVEQDRVLVAAAMDSVHDLSGSRDFSAMCSCGYEEHFGDEESAVEAAERHKSENPQHFPKAWAEDGRRLYG